MFATILTLPDEDLLAAESEMTQIIDKFNRAKKVADELRSNKERDSIHSDALRNPLINELKNTTARINEYTQNIKVLETKRMEQWPLVRNSITDTYRKCYSICRKYGCVKDAEKKEAFVSIGINPYSKIPGGEIPNSCIYCGDGGPSLYYREHARGMIDPLDSINHIDTIDAINHIKPTWSHNPTWLHTQGDY